jgi:peroxiredoxin
MRDWRQLKPRRSSLFDLVKGAALFAVLGAVLYFGWDLFFPSSQERPGDVQGDSPQLFSTSTATSTEVSMGSDFTNILTPTSVPVETIGTQAPAIGEAVRVGGHPPEFTLQDLGGVSHSLLDHQGQVVLINFWTTWCPPCREEMPALQQSYERFKNQGYVVLGVNWTAADDPDLVGPYVEELGLTFPILLDKDSTVSEGLYNLLGLPTSVFVGRDGIIREIIIGALELEALDNKITIMLEENL